MGEKFINLTAREAALAAQGKLTALVRVVKEPVVSKWAGGKRRVFSFPEDAAEINELLKSRQAHPNNMIVTPFGAPGDVLHGKETWCDIGAYPYGQHEIMYKSSYPKDDPLQPDWRSPVTMPRWAIRRHYRVLTSRACMASELYDDCNFSFEYAEHMMEHGIKDNQWVWFAIVEAIHA